MKLLLAEDEKALSKVIVKILEKNNYTVDAVFDGDDALAYLKDGGYDAAILDIMMPKKDGITVVKELRECGIITPVIMLTAKSETDDKVLGLDSGANDYLTKPFDTKELLARLRVLTRPAGAADNKLKFGNVVLDRGTFELSSISGSYRLANKEFQLMEVLMSNPGQLFSSERLFEKIWGADSDVELSSLWVYISYLRKKLKALHADIGISAVRNAGYTLEMLS